MEHARLLRVDRQLATFRRNAWGPRASYDFAFAKCVRKQLFQFEDLESSRKIHDLRRAMDVNIYVKRDFAPLAERIRYNHRHPGPAPATFAAAKANLRNPCRNRSSKPPFKWRRFRRIPGPRPGRGVVHPEKRSGPRAVQHRQ